MSDQTTSSVFNEQQETPAQEQQQQQAPAQEPTQEQQPAQQQQSASSGDVFADQLASIKNERGEPKYRDLPTALDALKHSQEYIPQVRQENETLKQELERIKAELEQRASLEDTVGRLTAQQREEAAQAPQELQGLTPEQVEELLDKRLTEREQRQKAQDNETSVSQAIQAKYGERARDVVQSKAQEYGMTPAEMQQWAAKNPKAVLALFEVKPTPQGNKPSSSSVNIPPIRPNESNDLAPPEKSLLRGASMKEQMEYMRRVREHTNKRLGVEN